MKKIKNDELSAGNVGYLIAGIKDVHDAKVGDTVNSSEKWSGRTSSRI
jgi:GTP-binding protein LepA